MRHATRRLPAAAFVLFAVVGSGAVTPVGGDAAAGTTYYVDSTSGNDGWSGTSPREAWRTLDRLTSVSLLPGDTVLLRRQSVFSEPLTISSSGDAESRITIGAYGRGPRPRFAGGKCVSITGSYVTVRDLTVMNCSWAGISVSGSWNVVAENVVTGNVTGVYIKAGAIGTAVTGNRIVDNNRMSVLTADPTTDDSGAFGVLLHGDFSDVSYNSISGSDSFSYDYGRDGAAVEVYGGRHNVIHHNVAIDNNMFSELGNSRSSDNTYAYNLVTSSLSGGGFLTTRGAGSRYGPVLATRLYNNTVLLQGSESEGSVCHAGCGPSVLTMRNNVIQAVKKVGYADAPFDDDHGLYWGGRLQFVPGPNTTFADPGFSDPTSGNLRLRPDSPAVDSGAALPGFGLDLDGAQSPADGNSDGIPIRDRGAFERQPLTG